MRNYTTQMDAARKGILTPEIKTVAQKEHMSTDEMMKLVAEGKVAICANKVHTVLSVKTYYIDEILCSQSSKISLIVDDAVIDRNSSDHCRTFVCQLLPERLSVAVAG